MSKVEVIDLSGVPYRNFSRVIGKNRFIHYFCVDIGEHNSWKRIVRFLKDYGFDYVFHLAGVADIVPSINRPIDYFNANVSGTINMLEAARLAKVKKFRPSVAKIKKRR